LRIGVSSTSQDREEPGRSFQLRAWPGLNQQLLVHDCNRLRAQTTPLVCFRGEGLLCSILRYGKAAG
jgi:hypothetical protein